ncbi:ABC-2 type transport system permease protein [Desulfonispora thiosulfatigenes DSM 11270]|uniref:ABC-2 type transport system permease protein n=1 Tax=Desulfonispora thiosulfatigenes DSM 11270 TaxID=656914 RepID=A0A1W1UES3_DESTI|nr:ABC transporter permease [Desulfonispora thiosulfatigenes]SMB79598.1 ABC-2 type transport system permease protein [Desulfonispora thiosulfatigenes DSM 11270]
MKAKILNLYNLFLTHKEVIISIILLLTIPPIASMILGYEFKEHVVNNVTTAIVDHDNSTLSRSLVDKIKTNDAFNVTNYPENNDDIENLIDKGEIVVGMIIPENFSIDLLNGQAPKVLVAYDGAQMSAVSSAKGRISEILSTIKAGYLIGLGGGKLGLMPGEVKDHIMPLNYTYRFLGNPAKSISNYMLQGMLIGVAQVGIVILGVVVANKKGYLPLWIKSIVCGLLGAIAILSTIIIQVKYFGFPFKGSVLAAIILTVLYSIGITSIGITLGILKDDKMEAANSSMSLVSATILLAGYTFPVMAMPGMFGPISKYVPFLYYGIPMRDISLLGLNLADVLPEIYWLTKFVLIMWGVLLMAFLAKTKKKSKEKSKIGTVDLEM